MVDHTVKAYDNELDMLDRRIAQMGGIAEKMVIERLTFQRRTLKTSQRVAPSGSQTPGLSTGATPPPAVHPRGPTGTPRATRRQPRGGRVATRGSPLWTPGMNRSR